MLVLLYVAAAVAAFLPWTILVRTYALKVNIDNVIKELKEVADRLSKTPPRKEKKLRLLQARYKALRGRVSRFFLLNLMGLWAGIFTSLIAARAVLYYASVEYGFPLPPSPLNLPGISINGQLNDLILYLAVILGYQYVHNELTSVSKLSKLKQ